MYTSNETENIILENYSDSVFKAIADLNQGTFTKIICGAANTNEKQVERLALVYALSGANVIDVSPTENIINAAKSGIKKASELYNEHHQIFHHYKEPVLMISLDAGDDLHFKKAEINQKLCANCFKCIDDCPAGALSLNNYTLQLNKETCYGCGRCEQNCSQRAISFTKFDSSIENLQNIKAIEIHTGNNSIEEVQNFLELNSEHISNTELLSFCVTSKRFSPAELVNYVNSLIDIAERNVIIQIDGIPMGSTDLPCSSLQTISSAAILLENQVNAYIQLSGGTNYFTKRLVNKFGLKISGIGYGTFARKILLPYIEGLNDSEFMEEIQRIVNITTSLVNN